MFLPFMDDMGNEDEPEDPDIVNDPINKINLKVSKLVKDDYVQNFLEQFLRDFAKNEPNILLELGKQLAPSDQQVLQSVVTSQ